jgi:uncharacterized protein (TIGR02246 family)
MPDERGIEEITQSFLDSWNNHDVKMFAELFAHDADFTNVIGTTVHGREEIETLHAPRFKTIFAESRQTLEEVKIRWLAPELAAVELRLSLEGAKDEHGAIRPTRRASLLLIEGLRDARWEILVAHNTEIPPK